MSVTMNRRNYCLMETLKAGPVKERKGRWASDSWPQTFEWLLKQGYAHFEYTDNEKWQHYERTITGTKDGFTYLEENKRPELVLTDAQAGAIRYCLIKQAKGEHVNSTSYITSPMPGNIATWGALLTLKGLETQTIQVSGYDGGGTYGREVWVPTEDGLAAFARHSYGKDYYASQDKATRQARIDALFDHQMMSTNIPPGSSAWYWEKADFCEAQGAMDYYQEQVDQARHFEAVEAFKDDFVIVNDQRLIKDVHTWTYGIECLVDRVTLHNGVEIHHPTNKPWRWDDEEHGDWVPRWHVRISGENHVGYGVVQDTTYNEWASKMQVSLEVALRIVDDLNGHGYAYAQFIKE